MKQVVARSWLLPWLVVGLVGCAGAGNPALDSVAAREEIALDSAEQAETDALELLRELELANTNDDVEAVAALYTGDALWVQRDGSQVRGLTDIRRRYAELFDAYDVTMNLNVASLEVDGLSARVLGNTTVQLRPRSGEGTQDIRDRFIMVLRRDEAGPWRIWRLAWTSAG